MPGYSYGFIQFAQKNVELVFQFACHRRLWEEILAQSRKDAKKALEAR